MSQPALPGDLNKEPSYQRYNAHNNAAGAKSYKLSTNQGGADHGVWLPVPLGKCGSFHAWGTFGGATVDLRGSNKQTPSDSADDGFSIGTMTAEGVVHWDYPVRFIKAKTTGGTGSSIDSMAHIAY